MICDISVEHPSVAKVARQVPPVVPVGPPLAPGALAWLPQRVLDDAEMVGPAFCVAVVEGEADAVWHGAVHFAQGKLFDCRVLFQVPLVDFVGCRVDSGHASCCVRCDGGLLVGVLAVLQLKNLAHEHSLGVSRVRTCLSKHS